MNPEETIKKIRALVNDPDEPSRQAWVRDYKSSEHPKVGDIVALWVGDAFGAGVITCIDGVTVRIERPHASVFYGQVNIGLEVVETSLERLRSDYRVYASPFDRSDRIDNRNRTR